jgi:hypothetical protein
MSFYFRNCGVKTDYIGVFWRPVGFNFYVVVQHHPILCIPYQGIDIYPTVVYNKTKVTRNRLITGFEVRTLTRREIWWISGSGSG